MRLAFDLGEENKRPHRINKNTKVAAKNSFYSFLKRNPEFFIRQPENISIARALTKKRLTFF